MLRNRIFILIFIAIILALLLVFKLFQLQVVQGDYWEQQTILSRFKMDPIPFHRGSIFDRYGNVLATDIDAYEVQFTYRPFRRSHFLAQLTHLLSIVGGRRFSLLEVAAEPEKSLQRLAACAAVDFSNINDAQSKDAFRFYLARLLNLNREEQLRLSKAFSDKNPSAVPLVTLFNRDLSSLRLRFEKSLEDLFILEKRLGWEKASLIQWIEEYRKNAEKEVEKGLEGVQGSALQIARRKQGLVNDWEQRKRAMTTKTDYELVHFLALHRENFPGFVIYESSERSYPAGVAVSTIGLVQSPSEEDLKKAKIVESELSRLSRIFDRTDEEQDLFEDYLRRARSPYLVDDQKGRLGLESLFEDNLRGERGSRLVDDERFERLAIPIEDIPAVDGEDLVLTLSAPLQAVAENALKEGYEGKKDVAGSIIVIDCITGELLALATNPTFTVESYRNRNSYDSLRDDPRYPLHHRAYNPYHLPAPGSVFKLVVAAAALEKELITPDYRVNCQHVYKGLKCNDSSGKGHGELDLYGAIKVSCNVYFYQIGERLGVDTIADYAEDHFGFNKPTGFELKEVKGIVDRKRDDPRHFAIGQTLIAVTPLQVARAYAALANGGHLVVPHIVRNLGLQESHPKPTGEIEISAKTFRILEAAMARVVEPGGTARPRDGWDLRTFGVVGKSGTAEEGRGIPDNAWFAGYLPLQSPRVAFCVFIERVGKHGGDFAAPIAYKVLSSEAMQRYLAEAK